MFHTLEGFKPAIIDKHTNTNRQTHTHTRHQAHKHTQVCLHVWLEAHFRSLGTLVGQ